MYGYKKRYCEYLKKWADVAMEDEKKLESPFTYEQWFQMESGHTPVMKENTFVTAGEIVNLEIVAIDAEEITLKVYGGEDHGIPYSMIALPLDDCMEHYKDCQIELTKRDGTLTTVTIKGMFPFWEDNPIWW